jgi:hypothetical protein
MAALDKSLNQLIDYCPKAGFGQGGKPVRDSTSRVHSSRSYDSIGAVDRFDLEP